MALQVAPARRLHAASVLLHPLWLVGTATLALNDHVLKGGALLPDFVTGKLSDAAGMLVAPALLAAALGVRTLRGWWASHVAVGVVFAAIKLSSSCAALWSALMGAFGFAWSIVVDPTDLLVAIPALVLAERLLRGALTSAPMTLARRSGEAAAAGAGLFCSVATSAPEQPLPEGEFPEESLFQDIEAEAWIHNGTDEVQVVRVRQLRESVAYDCSTVASDPARLLDSSLFGEVQSWTLPVDANMAVVEPSRFDSCNAAWVDVDGFDPLLLFWDDAALPMRVVPGSGFDASISGGIELVLDVDDGGHFEGDASIMFEPAEVIEPAGVCAAQDDADRVDWGETAPVGDWLIAGIEPGVDGCIALDLATSVEPDAQTERFYLCVPELALPFAVGDAVSIDMGYAADADGHDTLTIASHDAPARTLIVSRGRATPAVAGLLFEFRPIDGCAWTVDACGTVARAGELLVGSALGSPVEVQAGTSRVFEQDDGSTATVMVAHAQDRVVIDQSCADGPEQLGTDLDVVVLIEAAQ